MAKEYSEKSFLTEVDDYSLVERYLSSLKPPINDFSYTKPETRRHNTESVVEQIETVLRKQSDPVQQEIERDFQHINSLSNDKGTQNLIAEAQEQGVSVPLDAITAMNVYDRAFWFFNNHREVFDQADAVQQFYDLSGWKRVPVPTKAIDVVLGKKAALIDALKKYYGESEARGKYGEVDMYPKGDRVYVVARLTGNAESNYIPDEKTGGFKKNGTRRTTFEVYFLYRPHMEEQNGAELEIKARGGWQKQRDLLSVFTTSVFDYELDDTKQTYSLDMLKDPSFAMVADPELQMEWWWMKSIELLTKDRLSRVKVTVSDDRHAGTEAVWRELRKLNLADKVSEMLINSADFQVKFKTTHKRQKGTATFHINWKDTCSLNPVDEFNIKASQVLKTSKLDRGFNH